MNKEEILAKSKQENRGQDIANLEVSKASMQFGWITAVCLLSLVAVVEAVVYERMNAGIFFAIMAGCSAIFINKFLKLHKRHELYMTRRLPRQRSWTALSKTRKSKMVRLTPPRSRMPPLPMRRLIFACPVGSSSGTLC